MELTQNVKDGIAYMLIDGNLLGEVDNKPLIEAVTTKIEDGNNKFLFKLEGLKFINSTGLGTLLTALTKSRNAGGEMVLTQVPDQLSKLLVITKLNSIFTIVDSEEEALELLNNK